MTKQRRIEILRIILICVALATATLLSFQGVRSADFVNFDDNRYVYENLIVQRGLTAENIKWAFTTFYFNNWHPLTWLSYMTECELFGLKASAFHLVNLAFHVANTLLVFLLLRDLTRLIWPCAMVAALFGLHPLHVESVAWISERKDVLSTFFGLLAIACYAGYVRRRCAGWYTAVILLFLLSLMSKAMLVTFPFVLLLLDLWPLRRLDLNTPGWWRQGGWLLLEKLPFLVFAVAASYVAYIAQGASVATGEQILFTQRLENVLMSYARYLAKTFWPANLVPFYPYPFEWPSGYVGLAAALLAFLSVIACLMIRARPWFFTGWFWFLGTLVPVIGLVQIGRQSIADRYMYLPSIGLFIALVWGFRELVTTLRMPRLMIAASSFAVLTACGWLTARQVTCWQNGLTLFTHTVRNIPPNVEMLNNLAGALTAAGRTNEARATLAQALELNPQASLVWGNLGNILVGEGKFAEAADHYKKALAFDPKDAELNFNLGLTLRQQGQLAESAEYFQRAIAYRPAYLDACIHLGNALAARGDSAAAITNYEAAIRIKPDFAPAWYNLGTLCLDSGRTNQALHSLREAVRLKPDYGEAHRQLGAALARLGDERAARQHLEQAVRFTPKDPFARQHLAALFGAAGETERAIAEYREALRLDPNLLLAINNLAWLLATHPDGRFRDGQEAVRLAERACQISQRRQPFLLGTLAAAYAEAGRFDDAIKFAQEAITLAESQSLNALADTNRQLLKSYQKHQPWRSL